MVQRRKKVPGHSTKASLTFGRAYPAVVCTVVNHMNRRIALATFAAAGGATLAGCGSLGGTTTLSDPTLITESDRRRSLTFTADGEEIANFGADGTADGGRIDVDTELSHSSDTTVDSISLGLAMPAAGRAASVAVVSPVEGDSSPPPELTLSTPADGRGTLVEVTDLDDLADETVSTLSFVVTPPETATTLTIDCEIELSDGGVVGGGYALDGSLELQFPEFGNG